MDDLGVPLFQETSTYLKWNLDFNFTWISATCEYKLPTCHKLWNLVLISSNFQLMLDFRFLNTRIFSNLGVGWLERILEQRWNPNTSFQHSKSIKNIDGGVLKWSKSRGYTVVLSSISRWDFPWNKPSICGYPQFQVSPRTFASGPRNEKAPALFARVLLRRPWLGRDVPWFGKIMGKSWENHGKIIGKPQEKWSFT